MSCSTNGKLVTRFSGAGNRIDQKSVTSSRRLRSSPIPCTSTRLLGGAKSRQHQSPSWCQTEGTSWCSLKAMFASRGELHVSHLSLLPYSRATRSLGIAKRVSSTASTCGGHDIGGGRDRTRQDETRQDKALAMPSAEDVVSFSLGPAIKASWQVRWVAVGARQAARTRKLGIDAKVPTYPCRPSSRAFPSTGSSRLQAPAFPAFPA